MIRSYAIIADDLTGAGDTGAQFARVGLRTIALMGHWTSDDLLDANVVVVSTDSRPLSAEQAASKVTAASQSLTAAGIVPFFKKVDSTMRGPIGAEIDAIMQETGLEAALVCPAFPANGRALVGGYLLVEGQPVARGAAGKDPVAPVRESHVPTLLAAQSGHPVLHCSLRDLESGLFPTYLRQAKATRALLVCDAVADSDLTRIAREAMVDRGGLLFVGAAGLAGPVAEILASELGTRPEVSKGVSVLTAIGSLNPVAREQAKRLMERNPSACVVVRPYEVLGPDAKGRLEQVVGMCVAMANAGANPIVMTAGNPEDVVEAQRIGSQRGLSEADVAAYMATALAEVVHGFVRQVPRTAVAVTGGDVARAVLSAFGSNALDIVGEVSPGIPVCSLRGGERPGLRIVTKAGGFGKPDSLEKAIDLLRESCRNY